MKKIVRGIQGAVFGIAALTLAAGPVQAQEKVRFAFIKAMTLIPFFYADQKGYFKEQGLDVEMISVNSGPAVAAAISGGSADIGFSGATIVLNARAQGQPYRFFIGLNEERYPNLVWNKIIASKKSGVTDLAGLKGKTVIVGAVGSLCEVAMHLWVERAGLKPGDVTILNTPVSQAGAAMEIGNAQGACLFEPFLTAAMNSAAEPIELAKGYLAGDTRPFYSEGIFANENWLAKNPETVRKFKAAVQKAWQELAKDREQLIAILKNDFRFPPALFDKVTLDYDVKVGITAEMLQPVVEAMNKRKMLDGTITAKDAVFE